MIAMGVRGLQTFLESYCPSACYTVKVAELAKEYKNETGKEPVVVIDAQSCYSLWSEGLDWVIGFEIQELFHRLQTFVECFKKIGVRIVFFFGGPTVEKKRESWIERRRENLRKTFIIFDLLEKGSSTKDIPNKYASFPPTMGLVTSMLLKYVLKCEVYLTVEECDEVIVEYVSKNDCLAIFAQDTDFIVSDVRCKVLSAKNFQVENTTTLLYDRAQLAKILRIRIDQLPLLGILAGNDLIKHDSLRGFHCWLCGMQFEKEVKYHILMPAIGRYINKLPDRPIDEILELICEDIFEDKELLDVVHSAYDCYLVQETPRITNPMTKWSRILQIARFRHRNALIPVSIWAILNNQTFELPVSFEDLRRSSTNQLRANSYCPSATVTRLLRRRMYGILLYDHDQFADIKVKEWCGENVKSYHEPVLVDPVKPTVHHPGLLQLWSDNNSNRYSQMKWKLFLSCISPKINLINDWCALTEDLVTITATLYYLYEQQFLGGYEMNAVMATIATYSLYSREKLEELNYGSLDFRCTHISVTVIRTFCMVFTLMAACGYPVPMCGELIYLKFEAKLFQIKFKQIKDKKTVEELCEKNDRCIEIFNQMRRVLSRAGRNSKKPTSRDVPPKIHR